MIEVVIADHLELFSIGLTEVLAGQDDVRVVGQPQSPEQLLKTLKKVKPHVLVLSTDFLPVYPRIQRILKRRKTALLVLAEGNDRAAYMFWLRAHGIVYRSMDGPAFLDAMRRVTRGELFVQKPSSDISEDKCDIA
jgi:DNA-binding NarL/FixJ family response regulator